MCCAMSVRSRLHAKPTLMAVSCSRHEPSSTIALGPATTFPFLLSHCAYLIEKSLSSRFAHRNTMTQGRPAHCLSARARGFRAAWLRRKVTRHLLVPCEHPDADASCCEALNALRHAILQLVLNSSAAQQLQPPLYLLRHRSQPLIPPMQRCLCCKVPLLPPACSECCGRCKCRNMNRRCADTTRGHYSNTVPEPR